MKKKLILILFIIIVLGAALYIGKDEVYKMICNGRYGTYDGKWVDLQGDHWDKEAHNCVSEYNMHLND